MNYDLVDEYKILWMLRRHTRIVIIVYRKINFLLRFLFLGIFAHKCAWGPRSVNSFANIFFSIFTANECLAFDLDLLSLGVQIVAIIHLQEKALLVNTRERILLVDIKPLHDPVFDWELVVVMVKVHHA